MKLRVGRRRKGISEVLGSLIMIAITLVAGAAVFGFINGQTGSSAAAVGASAANNINYLNEREVIVTAALGADQFHANMWIYNNGAISPENMSSVLIYNVVAPTHICTVSLHQQSAALVAKFTVSSPISVALPVSCQSTLTFLTGQSYNFQVVGLYGSKAQLTVQF